MASNQAPRGQQSAAGPLLHALLDAAVDAIVTIDSTGEILSFNRAAEELFGYAQNEVLGRSVHTLMPEPHRGEHAEYMRRYLTTGERRVIGVGREVQGLHSSGRLFPIWLSVGEAAVGGERYFVGIIRDLSAQKAADAERHELEARLAQVARLSLMGEMAAGVAHEINQPLSAIVTYAQAARRLLENPAAEKEALDKACVKIADQVHRASQVIENLRNFIRKRDVEKEPIDLNPMIDGVMTFVLADAQHAGVPLTTSFAEGLPRVEGDTILLQQVLLNLTRNALDAMQTSLHKEKGIRISTFSTQRGEVGFEVRDRGTGVSARLGQAIFHPFVTTKPQGLGVGLAISRTIVQNHGGKLTYSDNPDGGAVFTVSLPAANRSLS